MIGINIWGGGTCSRLKWATIFFVFFLTLVTGPRRSLSLKLSDTKVYEYLLPFEVGNHRDPAGELLVARWAHVPLS